MLNNVQSIIWQWSEKLRQAVSYNDFTTGKANNNHSVADVNGQKTQC